MWSAGFTNPNQWCTLSWGFHTVWGGIDPRDHRLGSWLVEFMIRGWDLNLPVSAATSTLAGGATLAAHCLHEPANQQPASVVGVSTPCGAVSTRRIPVFVPMLLELIVEIWKDL